MTSHIRRAVFLAITALLCLPLLGVPSAAAAVDTDAEASFLRQLNAARADAGVAPVEVADDLVAVARRHSARMAAEVRLHHNPSLGEDVADWQKVGENVGRGPRVQPIHDAFMASDGHRRNILDADWTEVGIGVEVVDGRVWVTQVFREPLATVSQHAPTAANTPATAAPSTETPGTAPSTARASAPTRPVAAPTAPRLPLRVVPRPAGRGFDHTAAILTRVAASLATR